MFSPPSPCENPTPFCAQLDPQVRAELCAVCTPVSYRKRKKLYVPNLRPRILIMRKGLAARKMLLADGKQICNSIDEPNDIVGSIYSDRETRLPFHKSRFSEVLQTVEGGLIATVDVRNLCNKYPELTQAFLAAVEDRAAKAIEHSFRLAAFSSTEKVAYALSIMEKHGMGLDELTHEEIASLLNMNRVTVTKAMKTVLESKQSTQPHANSFTPHNSQNASGTQANTFLI